MEGIAENWDGVGPLSAAEGGTQDAALRKARVENYQIEQCVIVEGADREREATGRYLAR